jgi:hypothetical protein
VKNSLNYSVVYRFNITGFTGEKATLRFNPRTNPNYLADADTAIYAAFCLHGGAYRLFRTCALLQPQYKGHSTEYVINDLPKGSFTMELVVSGISSMPLEVIFERGPADSLPDRHIHKSGNFEYTLDDGGDAIIKGMPAPIRALSYPTRWTATLSQA